MADLVYLLFVRIALVSETYLPEINDVAITLSRLAQGLRMQLRNGAGVLGRSLDCSSVVVAYLGKVGNVLSDVGEQAMAPRDI